jgi:hypothetical protein
VAVAAGDADDILVDLTEADAGEVGRYVRCQVTGGIVQLVQQLLPAGGRADQATAPRCLGDQCLARSIDLCNLVTDVREVWNVFAFGSAK